MHPLTGSKQWIEFDGTSVTRKVWYGRAWIEEFETDGPTGHIEGLTLRLYNPESHQWSLYWANSKNGTMGGPPNVGEFKDGRAEFLSRTRSRQNDPDSIRLVQYHCEFRTLRTVILG